MSETNLTRLRLRNEVGRGARNMVNVRRTKKRNNAAVRKARKASQNSAVKETQDNTMRELDEYIRYCGDLRSAYDKKHGEVREATDKIKDIKRRLSEMSDDILRNLREAQGLNNRNNSSPEEAKNNSDEILKILRAIMSKIPDGFRDDIGRLTQLQREQSEMIGQRNSNHSEINRRLDAIRDRLADVKNVQGMQPRGATAQARALRGIRPNNRRSPRSPPRSAPVNLRTAANNKGAAPKPRSVPTTARGKSAQKEVNTRLKRSTMKMVTGKGGRLTAQDFKEPFNAKSKL